MADRELGKPSAIPAREQVQDVQRRAALHAVRVHEGRSSGLLTPNGIAWCAAGAAIVLLDQAHPNHDRLMAWTEGR